MDLSFVTPPLIVAGLSLLVAIIIGLVVHWWRNRIIFGYRVLTNRALFAAVGSVKHRLQITYDSSPVNDLSFLHLRFSNAGYASITSTDVENPVTVVLRGTAWNNDVRILQLDRGLCQPDDLNPEFTLNGTEIVITPLLLNRGDFFDLELIANVPTIDFVVKGRIKDVPRIRNLGSVTRYRKYFLIPLVVGLMTALVLYVTYGFIDTSEGSLLLIIANLFAGVCVGIGLGGTILFDNLFLNRPRRFGR